MTLASLPMGSVQTAQLPGQGDALESPRTVMTYTGVFIWCFFLLVPPVPQAQALWSLIYPAGLLVILSAFADWRSVMKVARGFGLFLLLPTLMLVSLIWSAAPAAGLKFFILYAFGLITVISICSKVRFNDLVLILWIVALTAAVLSALNPNARLIHSGSQVAELGLYAQKNVLGKRMLLLCVLSSYILVSRYYGVLLRSLSVMALALSLWLILKSNSTSALVLAFGSIAAFLGLLAFVRTMKTSRGMGLLVILGVSLVAALVTIWVGMSGMNPVEAVLAAFGKNSTLTGRTEIWSFGNQFVANHPLLGAGLEGFWRRGQDEAIQIATLFTREDGAFNFYFHNAGLEYLVHLGYFGYFIFLIALSVMLFRVAGDFVRYLDARACLALVFVVIMLMRSNFESEFYSALEPNVLFAWMLVGYACVRRSKDIQPQHLADSR